MRADFDLNIGPHARMVAVKPRASAICEANGSFQIQVIQCKLQTDSKTEGDLRGGAEVIPGGANGLMSFCTLGGGAVDARLLRPRPHKVP